MAADMDTDLEFEEDLSSSENEVEGEQEVENEEEQEGQAKGMLNNRKVFTKVFSSRFISPNRLACPGPCILFPQERVVRLANQFHV